MKVLFLDTNIFLQCRPLAELPWGDLAAGDDLLLLIPRPVQEEIDHLKQDGNSRRAKRARKASAFFRELLQLSDNTMTLREHSPKVQISFSPPIPAGKAASPFLDMSRSDDGILAELLVYAQEHPDCRAALLTHDTNPMLTAKRLDLEFLVIPDEWLLPPEQDERDKRISELERRLTQYERLAPVIDISVTDGDGRTISSAQLTIRIHPDLSSEQIEGLLAMARKRHPIATDFGEDTPAHPPPALGTLASNVILARYEGYEWKYQAPSKEAIAKYKETEYPAWEAELVSFFQKLAARLEFPTRQATFAFIVDNKGSVPAENIVVEFETCGGILFEPSRGSSRDKENVEELALPAPPKPPNGTWVRKPRITAFSSAPSLSIALATAAARDASLSPFLRSTLGLLSDYAVPRLPVIPPPRDRNKFYWKNGKPSKYTNKWTFECAEFRHQVHSEHFSLPLFIGGKDTSDKGAITCTISARNLPEPVRFVVPLFIERIQCDTVGVATALI
jgi:hypothetical protein